MLNALFSALAGPSFDSFYFWSTLSAGRTHLLYASCKKLADEGKLVSYIPLEQNHIFSPDILLGLEQYDLVCIDNIDCIKGKLDWEERIFDLFNQLSEKQTAKLLITANASPAQINFSLPDLASRLVWGQVYQLKALSDSDKLQALQLRSSLRGFDLPTEVGLFLLKRVNRDMRTLFSLLEKLDIASMTEQRKLTIPFIKEILNL